MLGSRKTMCEKRGKELGMLEQIHGHVGWGERWVCWDLGRALN